MTDKEETVPTAAYRVWFKNSTTPIFRESFRATDNPKEEYGFRKVDELVRRKDVKKLIENKIEETGSNIDRQHYDSEDNPERKAVKILGELLEEISNK